MIPIVVCILIKDGKVLSEKRPEDEEIDPGNYCFPAGHIEDGESKVNALRREMREELGIELNDPKFFKSIDYKTGGKEYEMNYFVCTDWQGQIKSKEVIGTLHWLDDQSCSKFDFYKDVKIARAALKKYNH